MPSPNNPITLKDKVFVLLVDFAITDRREKKALRRIRDEIIQTVRKATIEDMRNGKIALEEVMTKDEAKRLQAALAKMKID